MGLIDRLFRRNVVNQTHPRDPVLAEWFRGGGAAPAVTPQSVLGVPAVNAAVNVLAESVGSLPPGVWRRLSDGKREEAEDHALHRLLTGRPCSYMTGVEWIEWLVASTALRGDAFAHIVSDQKGALQALVPMDFMAIRPEMRDDGVMRYLVQGPQRKRKPVLQDDEVFRLPWKIQPDGSSISPIGLHRESFALALSARRYQMNLLTNGAQPKGGLKVPSTLSDAAAEALIRSWEKRHGGANNAGKLAVLDGGLEWQAIGMSNEDAQFVELLQMSVRDVARIFRVQPHKIGDLEKATFSNIEHQSIEFVTDTLLPWVRRIEARMEGWLLSERERKVLSVEFNLRGLLRGDASARAELYKALFYASAISPNEMRRLEGMNPTEGGDRFYVQGATVPSDIIDQVLLRETPVADDIQD